MTTGSGSQRTVHILALILAGEAIFFLPFVISRVFRPTFLEVFGLTNFQLGTLFSVYGTVAMIAYFPGGLLADRLEARKLLGLALGLTALGGMMWLRVPDLGAMKGLYAYWGLTTILLFWAALIRATREWGGDATQGLAFGLLDGGRGLFTAVMGTLMVAVFAWLLPGDVEQVSPEEKEAAFRSVIFVYGILVVVVAAFVWFALPRTGAKSEERVLHASWVGIREVIALPTVWLQALILICAYIGFQSTNDFSLLAQDALELDEVEAAKVGTISLWMRPLAAILGGVLADRYGSIRMTLISFGCLLIGSVAIALGILQPGGIMVFAVIVITTSAGIFALRGLYYAIMQEGNVPMALTGSAVGVVSVIGYTPDIFMGPWMGHLLDVSPGELGHQHVFALVAGFAAIGGAATMAYGRLARGMGQRG
ncbi:MAG: MFS transporter [Verrucomicrobiota bacterium]